MGSEPFPGHRHSHLHMGIVTCKLTPTYCSSVEDGVHYTCLVLLEERKKCLFS